MPFTPPADLQLFCYKTKPTPQHHRAGPKLRRAITSHALSACLQLTQRNHEKVWRNSLAAWRSLLHQKFSLLKVGVVGSRAGF